MLIFRGGYQATLLQHDKVIGKMISSAISGKNGGMYISNFLYCIQSFMWLTVALHCGHTQKLDISMNNVSMELNIFTFPTLIYTLSRSFLSMYTFLNLVLIHSQIYSYILLSNAENMKSVLCNKWVTEMENLLSGEDSF